MGADAKANTMGGGAPAPGAACRVYGGCGRLCACVEVQTVTSVVSLYLLWRTQR